MTYPARASSACSCWRTDAGGDLKGNAMKGATKRWLDEDERRAYVNLTLQTTRTAKVAVRLIGRLCSGLDKQQEVIGKLVEVGEDIRLRSPLTEGYVRARDKWHKAAAAARDREGRG